MEEKRKISRYPYQIIIIIKKHLNNNKIEIDEFLTRNMSEEGAYIVSEDTSIYDIGEIYNGIVDIESKQFPTKMKIIRRSTILDRDERKEESGFGLLYLDPPNEMLNELKLFLAKKKEEKKLDNLKNDFYKG